MSNMYLAPEKAEHRLCQLDLPPKFADRSVKDIDMCSHGRNHLGYVSIGSECAKKFHPWAVEVPADLTGTWRFIGPVRRSGEKFGPEAVALTAAIENNTLYVAHQETTTVPGGGLVLLQGNPEDPTKLRYVKHLLRPDIPEHNLYDVSFVRVPGEQYQGRTYGILFSQVPKIEHCFHPATNTWFPMLQHGDVHLATAHSWNGDYVREKDPILTHEMLAQFHNGRDSIHRHPFYECGIEGASAKSIKNHGQQLMLSMKVVFLPKDGRFADALRFGECQRNLLSMGPNLHQLVPIRLVPKPDYAKETGHGCFLILNSRTMQEDPTGDVLVIIQQFRIGENYPWGLLRTVLPMSEVYAEYDRRCEENEQRQRPHLLIAAE